MSNKYFNKRNHFREKHVLGGNQGVKIKIVSSF